MDSPYVSKRSHDWLKIKTHKRQEAIIVGYTQPQGSRKHFGALLLGAYNHQKNLVYIGAVGTGFDAKLLADIFAKLKPLIQTKCPFKTSPKLRVPAIWVKPRLVCEISFEEWTSDGRMRQPVFEGIRMDKMAIDVKKEEPIKLNLIEETASKNRKAKINSPDDKFKISHPDKIFWPQLKLTKGDLLKYYQDVSKWILPYLKNRPIMIKRFPDGVKGEGFIQKDTKNLHLPPGIETVVIEHEKKSISYFLIQNPATLEYVVNLGTIELHPFLSQISSPQKPDYFVIDLDPEDIEFSYVIETAKVLHAILEEFKINSVCKTSGKRGLHICIPMGRQYTFEQALQFGQILVQYAYEQMPEMTSLVRKPSKRQKKVYLDVLQNHYKQTVIAPYSARGTEFATVSTPLKWSEVKQGLDPKKFNITNVADRTKKLGDLFAPCLGKGINIQAILKKIQIKFGS